MRSLESPFHHEVMEVEKQITRPTSFVVSSRQDPPKAKCSASSKKVKEEMERFRRRLSYPASRVCSAVKRLTNECLDSFLINQTCSY